MLETRLPSPTDASIFMTEFVNIYRLPLVKLSSEKGAWKVHITKAKSTFLLYIFQKVLNACADPEGGGGVGDPDNPENYKIIGLLNNTGPCPLKNPKATKPSVQCSAI